MNILKIFIGNIILLGIIQSLFGAYNELSEGRENLYLLIKLILLVFSLYLIFFGIKKEYANTKRAKLGIFTLMYELIGNSVGFCKDFLAKKRPPFFITSIFLLGATIIFNIADSNKFINGGQITSWGEVWIMVLVFSIFYGYISYVLLGLIYKLAIKISGGMQNYITELNIPLYALLPVSFIYLIQKILYTFLYGSKYFVAPSIYWLDIVFEIIILLALIFGIRFVYKSGRQICGAKRIRSVIFFIIVPFLIVLSIFMLSVRQINYETYVSENYNENARQQLARGDFAGAEASLKFAIQYLKEEERMGDLITTFYNLAAIYQYSSDNESAILVYEDILSYIEPDSADSRSIEGAIALLKKDVPTAIEKYEEALKIDANNFTANNYLGLIYSGRYGAEFRDFEKALPFNKKIYDITNTSGNLDYTILQILSFNYYELGQYDKASPLLEKALIYDPGNSITLYVYALTKYNQGDVAKAKEVLSNLVHFDQSYLQDEEVQRILNETK